MRTCSPSSLAFSLYLVLVVECKEALIDRRVLGDVWFSIRSQSKCIQVLGAVLSEEANPTSKLNQERDLHTMDGWIPSEF